jgi:hypothetical protein
MIFGSPRLPHPAGRIRFSVPWLHAFHACSGAHADPNLDGAAAEGAGSVGGDAATWVGSVGVCRGGDLVVSPSACRRFSGPALRCVLESAVRLPSLTCPQSLACACTHMHGRSL